MATADWTCIPYEVLQEIFLNLDWLDLRSCTKVCRQWRYSSIDNWLWKPCLEKHYLWFNDPLMECESYFDEFVYFKDNIPKVLTGVIDDFEYNTTFCKFSSNGIFFVVVGEDAHFCLYRSEPLEFLHERTLKTTLTWSKINKADFSPNNSMLLLNGEKTDGTGEVAIFSINENEEVHFVSRVESNPLNFEACWFDNTHVLSGELHSFNFTSPLGSSISQLWLCSVERFTSESILVPIIRLLNKGGLVRMPLIVNYVSPRFRRILQLSEAAREEGKTLREKVDELTIDVNIDEGDIKGLKQILDKEQECYHCYLKHILTDKEYGSSRVCQCVCHSVTSRLLIYVCEKYSNRVCFKVIDQQLLSDALSLNRFKKKKKLENGEEGTSDQGEDDENLDSILKQFDYQDYHVDFAGQIDNILLSPDQKSLFISLESIEINHENEEVGISHEIKTIDLEKMILDPIGLRGKMKPIGRHFITANKSLVASFTTRKVFVWSKNHRGPSVQLLPIDGHVSSVALHPFENILLVTSGTRTLVYRPK